MYLQIPTTISQGGSTKEKKRVEKREEKRREERREKRKEKRREERREERREDLGAVFDEFGNLGGS